MEAKLAALTTLVIQYLVKKTLATDGDGCLLLVFLCDNGLLGRGGGGSPVSSKPRSRRGEVGERRS